MFRQQVTLSLAIVLTLLIAVAITSTPRASTRNAAHAGLDMNSTMSDSRMLASEAWDAF